MTHSNRRFVLAYLLLVIVPIAGLTGVLKSNSKLTAPTAIGGLWKMHISANNLEALPCTAFLTTLRDARFAISQSGESFTLSFANPAISSASGTIDLTNIKASLLLSAKGAKGAGCTDGHPIFLTATLNSKTSTNLMVGLLLVSDCPACTPVEFQAVREKPVKSTESI